MSTAGVFVEHRSLCSESGSALSVEEFSKLLAEHVVTANPRDVEIKNVEQSHLTRSERTVVILAAKRLRKLFTAEQLQVAREAYQDYQEKLIEEECGIFCE